MKATRMPRAFVLLLWSMLCLASANAWANPSFPTCAATADPFGSSASCGGMCTWNAGTQRITCSLANVCGPTDTENEMFGVTDGSQMYAVLGSCNNGGSITSFCCLAVDNGATKVEEIALQGTDLKDKISFEGFGQKMDKLTYGGAPNIVAGMQGLDEHDVLVASSATTAGFEQHMEGGDGIDYLLGQGSGNDNAEGGEGSDYISLQSGSDYAEGDDDDDFILGGVDAVVDELLGEGGNDTICMQTADAPPTGFGNINFAPGGGMTLDPNTWGIGCLDGGGVSTGDLADGGAGDDLIRGGIGDDLLQGGTGEDILLGRDGDDQICDPATDGDTLSGDGDMDSLHATAGSSFSASLDGGGHVDDACTTGSGLTVTNCPDVASGTCPF